jgi:hypothetical protein
VDHFAANEAVTIGSTTAQDEDASIATLSSSHHRLPYAAVGDGSVQQPKGWIYVYKEGNRKTYAKRFCTLSGRYLYSYESEKVRVTSAPVDQVDGEC